jgi:exopolysaccharide biosynthesis polyprenyl glycosylphosphotransferase
MLKEHARTLAVSIFVLDLALVALAFVGAWWLRDAVLPVLAPRAFPASLYPLSEYLPLLPIALGIWGALLLSSRRYASQRLAPLLDEAWEVLRVCGTALVIFTLAVFALRLDEAVLQDDRISRAWIVIFALLAGILLVTEKLALRMTARYARSRGFNYRSIVIVGTGPDAIEIARAIQDHRWWGFRILGFVAVDEAEARERAGVLPILGTASELDRIAERQVVDDVIVAVGTKPIANLEEVFLGLHELGIRTMFALDPFPHAKPQVTLSEIDGVPLLTYSTAPTGTARLALKRAMDLVLGTLLLIASLPIALLVVAGVKLAGGGSVLFRQTRCGLNGRRFTLYKFRTMVEDAESRQNELLHLNEVEGPAFKVKHDPRITRFGRLLRRFSLDELPQLLNVLRGDMSLVGPRPPIPAEVERYERWQRRRLSVKPGLTGLWQISGRADVPDFRRWIELDLQYIDSWSPWLDVKILAKTIPVVLSGRGAH